MKFFKNLAIALVFFFSLSQLAYAQTDTRIISLVPKEIYGTKTQISFVPNY
jgi:hypothetical protein